MSNRSGKSWEQARAGLRAVLETRRPLRVICATDSAKAQARRLYTQVAIEHHLEEALPKIFFVTTANLVARGRARSEFYQYDDNVAELPKLVSVDNPHLDEEGEE